MESSQTTAAGSCRGERDPAAPSSRKLLEDISLSSKVAPPSSQQAAGSGSKQLHFLSGHRDCSSFAENVPHVPQWVQSRPYMGTGFLHEGGGALPARAAGKTSGLASMPVEVEELVVLDELLSVMLVCAHALSLSLSHPVWCAVVPEVSCACVFFPLRASPPSFFFSRVCAGVRDAPHSAGHGDPWRAHLSH